MKILFACNSLISGGAERLLSKLIPMIQRDGNECHLLISSMKDERYLKTITDSGANVVCIPDSRNSHFSKIKYIKDFVIKNSFDVVHVNLFPMFYYFALAKAFSRRNSFPSLLLTEHSTSNKRRKKRIFRPIEKYIYSKYDKKICISNGVKNSLQKWLNPKLADKSLITINNGIDVDFVTKCKPVDKTTLFHDLSSESVLLCMIGSFTEDKNHLFMLSVFSKLPNNYHMVFIGEGKLEETIKNKIDELGIKNRVKLCGFLMNPYSVIKACDIVVIPSKREGFGLVAAEAMACQKPIVCSNVEGLSEVVGDAGIKCELEIDSFVKAIMDVASDSFRYIEKGKQLIKNYNIIETKIRYMNIFKEIAFSMKKMK